MADDALRRLEREATGGTPAVCLALAQALRRAGRPDDAVVALLPARRDPVVHAALAQLPAWTHPRGPDRTRHLDVRPLREAPRLRWARPPRGAGGTQEPVLLGGPSGLVTCRAEGEVTLLDPESGEVRATAPLDVDEGAAPPGLSLAGPVLLVHDDARAALRAIDTGDGRERYRANLVLSRHEVHAWDLAEPTRPPDAPTALRLPKGLRRAGPLDFSVQGHGLLLGAGAPARRAGALAWARVEPATEVIYAWRVVVRDDLATRHVALDRATGEVRWQAPGLVLAHDRAGVLARHGREVTIRTVDGDVLWTRELDGHGGEALALTPAALVLREGHRLVALERASGRALADLGPWHAEGPPWWGPTVAVARDVVYVAQGHGALAAMTLDGRRLWELSLQELTRGRGADAARLRVLVPAPDRLFAVAADGTVYGFGPAA